MLYNNRKNRHSSEHAHIARAFLSFSVVVWKTERKKYPNLSQLTRKVLRVPFSITGKCLDQLECYCNLKGQHFEQVIFIRCVTKLGTNVY